MNSDYTFLEAIHLIIDFYTSPKGYFIDEDFEYPEVRKFIDAGCASLGEEHKEKYLLNEKGTSILHPYIEEISSKFIQFMERKQNTATIKETENWFSKQYSLDSETSREICNYICLNLPTYGYTVILSQPNIGGDFYRIEKCNR